MTYADLANKYGFKDNYFTAMKAQNREKFKFIFSFSDNREESVELYIRYVSELILNCEDLFLQLGSKEYGKMIIDLGLTTNELPHNVTSSFNDTLFRVREDGELLTLKFNFVEKLIKIFEHAKKVAWWENKSITSQHKTIQEELKNGIRYLQSILRGEKQNEYQRVRKRNVVSNGYT